MRRPRSSIRWGATASALGVALSLVVEPLLGGALLMVGVASMVVGLHHLGRSGADRPSPPNARASLDP